MVTLELACRRIGQVRVLTAEEMIPPGVIRRPRNPFQGSVVLGNRTKVGLIDFISRKEDVSAYTAAQKAIEWFQLPPEQVYSEKSGEPLPSNNGAPAPIRRAEVKETPPGKPVAKPAAEAQLPANSPTTTGPNPPLKFRLEKLQSDHPYLIERGLTPETLAEFGVGFCPKGMMANRIAIPIHNSDGQIVAYAGRWPGDPPEGTPKYKLPPGFRKSLELFNLHRARQESSSQPLIVVEGFFDAMRLYQLGHRKVVALMGSSLSPAQEELIQRHTTQNSLILVMLDEDEAGRTARDDIAARLAKIAFVRTHVFAEAGRQPEHLTPEEVTTLFT